LPKDLERMMVLKKDQGKTLGLERNFGEPRWVDWLREPLW